VTTTTSVTRPISAVTTNGARQETYVVTIGLAHRKDVEPPRAARELRRVLMEYLEHAAQAGTLPPGTRPA
jgi:hypothetical protein